MRTLVLASVAFSSYGIPSAQAQETVHWAAPSSPQTGQYAYFPMGTELALRTRIELNTKSSNPGDRFYLEVAEPLVYHGQVVVPLGSVAVGEVMRADRNGFFGKKGHLEVRLLYVQTPSGPVRLSGRKARAGTGQEVLAIGGAVLVAWPMLFIHGTSGKMPADTIVTAQLADDLRFPLQDNPALAAALAPSDAPAQTSRELPARFDSTVFAATRP